MASDTDPLAQLSAAGVAVWLDDLSRERLRTGSLGDLIRDRHVVGVTTNPTIFQKAISGADAYVTQLHDLATRGVDVGEALRLITTADVRSGCDVLRPTYDASNTVDGRVSIEVDRASPATPRRPSPKLGRCGGWSTDLISSSRFRRRSRACQRSARHWPRASVSTSRDLLPRAVCQGDRGVLRRSRTSASSRPRPRGHWLGRFVLRLTSRHRDRQAPRQDRHRRGEGAPR